MMIRILENINTESLEPKIQKIIDKITQNLANNVTTSYIDKTSMPDEMAVEFIWKYENNKEEYLGTWEINLNEDNIQNYSEYLNNISSEIKDAYAFIDNAQS